MSKARMNIVMLTGAGVSADSGVETFRASDGLWAKHNIEDVCTPEALERNPKLVLDFYNERRRQLKSVKPNAGHYAAAKLEEVFNVEVITQNVDNLHERAGSTKVLHLHGELLKCRSMKDPSYICTTEDDVSIGDLCPNGGQLRPHIVFFGEQVPMLETAAKIVSKANIVIVAGTSLAVYPAAGLVGYAPESAEIYVLDPAAVNVGGERVTYMRERFALAMPKLVDILFEKYRDK
ncbi:MAG: Sir2 family NAD-dependent protein deacetylase [Bacteroidales bacterium]|nr:NAD-dependent deacylase [Bacteroidales bacterium]MDD4655871.1 NAD-dependent deacylase [Bacteroidales bacterium]